LVIVLRSGGLLHAFPHAYPSVRNDVKLSASLRGSVTTERRDMLTRQSPPTKCWWIHLCCSRITRYKGIASRSPTCQPFVRNDATE